MLICCHCSWQRKGQLNSIPSESYSWDDFHKESCSLDDFLKADSFENFRPGKIETFFEDNYLPYAQGKFFFEAGAVNGFHLSESALLEDAYGWNGILVEAHSGFFARLAEGRPSNLCVHACLGDGGPSWFEQKTKGDHLGHSQLRSNRLNDACLSVETKTITQVLEECHAPKVIDYMVLDVELAFLEVWQGLDLDRWQVDFLAIEMKGMPSMEIIRAMDAHGLDLVKVLGSEDFLFARR